MAGGEGRGEIEGKRRKSWADEGRGAKRGEKEGRGWKGW